MYKKNEKDLNAILSGLDFILQTRGSQNRGRTGRVYPAREGISDSFSAFYSDVCQVYVVKYIRLFQNNLCFWCYALKAPVVICLHYFP